MERSKTIITPVIVALAILHEVGAVGLHLDATKELFQSLTPLNLLISIGALAIFHRQWTMNFGIFLFATFWGTYLIEILGVRTGAIFGEYYYGSALGPKVGGVPPLIGLLWVMLAYCSGIISQNLSSSFWVRVISGAILVVILDFMIEPVAIEQDFWYWVGNKIPAQNYFAWLVISIGIMFGFHSIKKKKTNPLATPVYLIQLTFFAIFMVVRLGV